jgi:hypothetical protein
MAMVVGNLNVVMPIISKLYPTEMFLDTIFINMARHENWTGIHKLLSAFHEGERKSIFERLIKEAGDKPMANRFRASRLLFSDFTTNKGFNLILVLREMCPEHTLLIRMLWRLVFDGGRSEACVNFVNRTLGI